MLPVGWVETDSANTNLFDYYESRLRGRAMDDGEAHTKSSSSGKFRALSCDAKGISTSFTDRSCCTWSA